MTDLRNSLTVKVSQKVDQVEILERFNESVGVRRPGCYINHTLKEEGSVGSNALGGIRFHNGCTVGSCVNGIVPGLGGFSGRHLFVCEKMGLQEEWEKTREKGGFEPDII